MLANKNFTQIHQNMNKEIQYIFKYLSVYTNVGVDIQEALGMVGRRIKHKNISSVLESVRRGITEGKSVKESFAHLSRGGFIDSVIESILDTAENSGDIPKSFMNISEYIKEHLKTKASLIGALIYPVGMFIASMTMIYFLIVMIFPKILPLFSSMNVTLPLSARIILGISNFLNSWGICLVLFSIIVSCTMSFLYLKKDVFKFFIQTFVLKLPYIGSIIRAKEYISISRSIGLLMQNHKTLAESLYTASESTKVLPFKGSLFNVLVSIESGKKVSDQFMSEDIFDDEWVDLLSVGEVTGSLPKAFSDISALYSERYKDNIQTLVRVSEPLALICSAFVVLIVALAVIQPMYSLIQHMHG